jgi:hypothetical protein
LRYVDTIMNGLGSVPYIERDMEDKNGAMRVMVWLTSAVAK